MQSCLILNIVAQTLVKIKSFRVVKSVKNITLTLPDNVIAYILRVDTNGSRIKGWLPKAWRHQTARRFEASKVQKGKEIRRRGWIIVTTVVGCPRKRDLLSFNCKTLKWNLPENKTVYTFDVKCFRQILSLSFLQIRRIIQRDL